MVALRHKLATQKVYQLTWDLDHIADGAEVDAWLREFPNAPDNSVFWELKDDLNLPDPVEFDAIGKVFETLDYPYTDVWWPIISKRMLDTLLSVRSFRYRAYPVLMIDCKQVYNEDLGRDTNSGIEYDNFFAVQVLEDLDVFDWENSIYERDSESPDVLESIEELVLKAPEEGFPPLFCVVTSYLKTRLYISSEARSALEAAGTRGGIPMD
jgi:hypothetical protein